MSKNGIRGYITLAVLFIVFSVIAFAAPFSRTAVFWLAYVFAAAAIAYQIYVFKISFSDDGDVKSKFYGFPIAKVGVIYLTAQLIISLAEMIFAAFLPVWAVVIINVIAAALAIVGCIAADAMRDEIVRQDVQLKKDVSHMRALQSMSAALAGQCMDGDTKELLQKLADEFKYSDPVSSDETEAMEAELLEQLKEIQKSMIDGDTEAVKAFSGRVLSGLAERNRICALNKRG